MYMRKANEKLPGVVAVPLALFVYIRLADGWLCWPSCDRSSMHNIFKRTLILILFSLDSIQPHGRSDIACDHIEYRVAVLAWPTLLVEQTYYGNCWNKG